jgi:hypothetical protein
MKTACRSFQVFTYFVEFRCVGERFPRVGASSAVAELLVRENLERSARVALNRVQLEGRKKVMG